MMNAWMECIWCICIFHEWCICVRNFISMNFLSCYEVISARLVMAWMLEISFILRNFHSQIKILHIWTFLQLTGCGMRKSSLEISIFAFSFPQFEGCGMQKCRLEKYAFCNFPSVIYVMWDAENFFGKFQATYFPFRNLQDAACGNDLW